jgi:hypothetical protein
MREEPGVLAVKTEVTEDLKKDLCWYSLHGRRVTSSQFVAGGKEQSNVTALLFCGYFALHVTPPSHDKGQDVTRTDIATILIKGGVTWRLQPAPIPPPSGPPHGHGHEPPAS